MKSVLLYRWPSRRGYFIDGLAPDAGYLPAFAGDTCEEVLERLQDVRETFLFHLDCTFTTNFPAGRLELLAELSRMGVQVLNGYVTNISKKYIQQFNCDHGFPDVSVAESGDPDEMLIVKSNYNSFGRTELRLSKWGQDVLGFKQPEIPSVGLEYRVIPRSHVDPADWSNPALVCERFVTNPDGIWYRVSVRRPKIVIRQFRCSNAIKRPSKSTVDRIFWLGGAPSISSGVEALVWRFVEAFQLDFGAIDVVTDEHGVATVIDVNHTPFHSSHDPEILSFLRED